MPKPMTPLIGIVNDCDCPEARMLVLVWGNPTDPSVEYINDSVRPLGPGGSAGRQYGHFPKHFTNVSEFGVTTEFATNGSLIVRRIGEGRATYPDGQPRRWQGFKEQSISPRLRLAGPLIAAVRTMHVKEPEETAISEMSDADALSD